MDVPTINDIKTQILTEKAEYESLNGLTSTSKVALYNLWAFIVAVVIWTLYQFHVIYQEETDQKIRAQKIYSVDWFRDTALSYRHGHPLVKSGYNLLYSDENYTAQEIEDALVVKRAAVIPLDINKRIVLFVKCATEENEELVKLTEEQQSGVVSYFERLAPAGTKLQVFSDEPDDLRLEIDFFYDPLVLTDGGARIDGTSSTPVQDAIRQYLKELDFNGEFSIAELVDIIQSIQGCSDREAYVKTAESNFQTPENFIEIENTRIANSGYMSITDERLTINFKSKTVTG